MGLGGGCALVEEGPVVEISKGSIIELVDGAANNIGGPSASLLLGIADIENVDLWCLSIVDSERAGIRLRDDTRRSIEELVGGETVSGEDSVIVRLRLGVDTPEGVAVGSPEVGRRSRDS